VKYIVAIQAHSRPGISKEITNVAAENCHFREPHCHSAPSLGNPREYSDTP